MLTSAKNKNRFKFDHYHIQKKRRIAIKFNFFDRLIIFIGTSYPHFTNISKFHTNVIV